MTALSLAARWLHLASTLGLVGVFTAMLLGGSTDRPTALAWLRRLQRLIGWLIATAFVSGVAILACQAVLVAGTAHALVEPTFWWRLLGHSRFGTVWLVRHVVLVLLAALTLLRERESGAADRIVWRVDGLALALVASTTNAWAGHAATGETLDVAAVVGDALHLAAAGAWFGALLPLVLLLGAAGTDAGADALAYAVLAIRRFSGIALITMSLLIATGLWNAWLEVGGVPALVGTRYGQLL